MKEIEIASNPFTPKSGWEPRVFVGRENEIEFFHKKLEEAKQGRCDHFLVLGDWGIGKTSLLKEFKRIAQTETILTSFVTIIEFQKWSTLLQASQQLIKEIPLELPVRYERLKHYARYLKGFGLSVGGVGGFQLPVVEINPNEDPQALLLNTLLNLWKDLKEKTDVVLVLLDDVQNYREVSEFLTLVKNVLSHDKIIDTGFLFVLSSTPDGWKQFLQRHHPIGRYFTPRLTLERLSKEKTLQALDRILKGTGVSFDEKIKENVHEYTQGHPYELQVLCYNLYNNQIGGKVTEEAWDVSLKDSLKELGEMVFDGLYSKASRNERIVLYLAAVFDAPFEQKEIIELSQKADINLPENTIKTSLSRLHTKGLLVKPDRFKHSLSDKLFREYISHIMGYDGKGSSKSFKNIDNLKQSK